MKLMLHWRGLEMHSMCREAEVLISEAERRVADYLTPLRADPTTKKSALADSVARSVCRRWCPEY